MELLNISKSSDLSPKYCTITSHAFCFASYVWKLLLLLSKISIIRVFVKYRCTLWIHLLRSGNLNSCDYRDDFLNAKFSQFPNCFFLIRVVLKDVLRFNRVFLLFPLDVSPVYYLNLGMLSESFKWMASTINFI